MVLGSNGENIYPEAIESKLGNLPLVSDCIVLQYKKRLVALVYPDYAMAESMGLDENKIKQVMEDNLKTLNSTLARYEYVSSLEIVKEQFPMTPKRTIKRYIVEQQYADSHK